MSSDTEQLQNQLERTQALIELSRFDEAISILSQLVASEPEIAPAWCLLAQAQAGAGDAQLALASADRAVALAPEDDAPHRQRSLALLMLGDHDGAIDAAREAVVCEPENWQTHWLLAICLVVAERDASEALQAAERAVALAPNEAAVHVALGDAYAMRGNDGEADRCFRQALALDPQYGPAHDSLARRQFASSSYGRAGNLAAAAAGFRDAVRVDPRDDASAINIERVFQEFTLALSTFIFLIAWLALKINSDTAGARIAPLLVLAVPAAFAVRFLSRLDPDLRDRLFYFAFHGRMAAVSIAQACAAVLLFVAALAPVGARSGSAIAAALVACGALVLLPGYARLWASARLEPFKLVFSWIKRARG